ncbi:helix-turn-helix domain-containing protein [Burkholderia plantarii]|uniref:helix-turn-helix domain-containing protein n=1 Tax=Burkholderia plantarii TaxID=41899 RepID=UPI0009BB5E99
MRIMQNMQTSNPLQAAFLVRDARRQLGLNQAKFALLLGKSQAVVSRYEKGRVDPPSDVVMHCVHILSGAGKEGSVPMGDWDQMLKALEAAVLLVRSLRDASVNFPQASANT